MNKVYEIGRLTADPELKTTNSGLSVTSFTIAVDRNYKKDETDFLDIVAWRNTAEFVCKWFKKGDPIVIEGSLQTRYWEDQSGKKNKVVEIVADNVEFCPRTKSNDNAMSAAVPAADDFTVVQDTEDLPF